MRVLCVVSEIANFECWRRRDVTAGKGRTHVAIDSRLMIRAGTHVIWVQVHHNGSSNDGVWTNQLNQWVLKVPFDHAVLVRPDVAERADMPVVGPLRSMVPSKRIEVTAGILASLLQLSVLMNS